MLPLYKVHCETDKTRKITCAATTNMSRKNCREMSLSAVLYCLWKPWLKLVSEKRWKKNLPSSLCRNRCDCRILNKEKVRLKVPSTVMSFQQIRSSDSPGIRDKQGFYRTFYSSKTGTKKLQHLEKFILIVCRLNETGHLICS